MIASALRSSIEQYRPVGLPETFARCALAVQRLTRGGWASVDPTLPSPRALADLLARDADTNLPAYFAYTAFAESMVARAMPGGDERDRAEAAFDKLDEIVVEPQDLAPLRRQLQAFIHEYDLFCVEAARAARPRRELTAFAP